MKASELRIGNLVDDNGDIREVISINSFECELENKNRRHYLVRIDNIKSISLTGEWLTKFEFEQKQNLSKEIYFIKGRTTFLSIAFNGIKWIAPLTTNEEIKSIHQLQNLYFALTGSELELKDK